MKKMQFLTMLALATMLGACSSATNLTGAKTLKEGSHEIFVGGSYSGNLIRNSDSDSTTAMGFDVAGRYGVTNDDEVGFAYRNAGQLVFDYKRALMSDSEMALSIGAGMGYLNVTVLDSSTKYMDFFIPLYFDYKIEKDVTMLLSAKYLLARASSDLGGSVTANNIGFSGGARFGEDSGFHAEFGYLLSLAENGSNAWQTSLGYFW